MIKETSKEEVLSFAKIYFPKYNKNKSPYEKIITYYHNNEIIGFINYSIIYDRAEIDFIAVKEEYRGKNIAQKLYDYFEKDLYSVNSITLEVKCNNERAINFYKKNGFKKASIRKEYYGEIDGLLMIKKLGD